MELGGLHHVTAVTSDAPRNLDFTPNILGLRLVKKTVNQEDVSAYHLFYGDGSAVPAPKSPSSTGRHGPQPARHGGIVEIGLRVPDRAALDWWADRFDELGVAHGDIKRSPAGRPSASPTPKSNTWPWSPAAMMRSSPPGAGVQSPSSTRFAVSITSPWPSTASAPTERS